MLDGDGNVMKKTEPIVKRQVISEKTASIVSNMMEPVSYTHLFQLFKCKRKVFRKELFL